MAISNTTTPLAQNSFDVLSIDNLLFQYLDDDVQVDVPATLRRKSIPVDLVDIFPHPALADELEPFFEEDVAPDGPPPRRASCLPPPAHAKLSFSLGNIVGSGRSGILFEVADPVISSADSDSSTPLPTGYLPPLVVKVSRQLRCQSVVREAWFYEEKECLQGVAIARYYSCYELRLQQGWRVHAWDDPPCRTNDKEFDYVPDFRQYPASALPETGLTPHPMLMELVKEYSSVYVTILERLGPKLPTGIRTPPDVRLKSPFTNQTHSWRAIGFQWAQKTPLTHEALQAEHSCWLDKIYSNISYWAPTPATLPEAVPEITLSDADATTLCPWEDSSDEIFDSIDFIPEHEDYSLSEVNTVGIAPHLLFSELIHTPHDRVYILLLERMGDELSPGVDHPESVRLDIKNIYEDIAHVGVSLALDIRSCNILAAPASNPNIPAMSPFTQRSHAWRIVDFDLALKTPYTPCTIFSDGKTWIDNMFYGLRLLPRSRIRTPAPSTR